MKNMEKEETHRYNSSLSTPPLSPGLTFPSPTSVLTSREEIRHRLSLVGRELSFSTARGVLPDQGSNTCLLRRQVDSLPAHHQGSPREPEPDDQGRPWGPVLTHPPATEGTWTRSLV